MAWTAPKTWNVKEKVTAALLNLHLRDNLVFLYDVVTGASVTKIGNTAIADGAITTNKVTDFHITTAKIAEGGVTTSKLPDGAVTNAKIASLNGAKLLSNSVPGERVNMFYGEAFLGGFGATVDFTHGLGRRPRLLFGYYGTTPAAAVRPIVCDELRTVGNGGLYYFTGADPNVFTVTAGANAGGQWVAVWALG